MLGSEFAVDQPAGLKALVIANSPASLRTWVAEANRLRAELRRTCRRRCLKHEAAGTIDSAEYMAATDVFNERHVCRIVPMPPEVKRTFDAIAADPTVYHTMNGPNEFHVIGTMKDWTIEGRLSTINVPVLLISGPFRRGDESLRAALCRRDPGRALDDLRTIEPHAACGRARGLHGRGRRLPEREGSLITP